MPSTMIRHLEKALARCYAEARRQGFKGSDRNYTPTAEDCEAIADDLVAAGLSLEIKNHRSLASIHAAAQQHDYGFTTTTKEPA
jgi:hypothetical protein